MDQTTGSTARLVLIEVPASVLATLADLMAPVLDRFLAEQGVDERVTACALTAYAGALTATAGLRVDGTQSVESQVPAFMAGWRWAKELADKPSANDGRIIVPGGAA